MDSLKMYRFTVDSRNREFLSFFSHRRRQVQRTRGPDFQTFHLILSISTTFLASNNVGKKSPRVKVNKLHTFLFEKKIHFYY